MNKLTTTLLAIALSFPVFCADIQELSRNGILYNKVLSDKESYPELILNGVKSKYAEKGLEIYGKNAVVQLDKYYSLGERMFRYHVKFADNAKAIFQSNTGDFKFNIDVSNNTIAIETSPIISKKVDFINSKDEFLVEIYHKYQSVKVRIVNVFTGEAEEINALNDGPGGHGIGVINSGFMVGMQHDYYCFGLTQGDYLLIRQITVLSLKNNLTLLMYGDSITEPESYFPANVFSKSWTQLIMQNARGESISSGRGGCTIIEVLLRIKNELPFLKTKYVLVTIGTNGGNTFENLCELIEFIISQNSIPILNNIPCNESRTQIENNKLIEKVRQKYNINGIRFDLATALDHDGLIVDQSTMFYEDYTGSWGQIYHHPNVFGSTRMYIRAQIDAPEIFQ